MRIDLYELDGGAVGILFYDLSRNAFPVEIQNCRTRRACLTQFRTLFSSRQHLNSTKADRGNHQRRMEEIEALMDM